MQDKKLNLGCGLNTPDGYINLDGSWNAWLAKHPVLRNFFLSIHVLPKNLCDISWNPDILIHDVRKTLPFQDNFFKAVYASHLLEHLYLEEANLFLRDCFRVLQNGGVLRIVVPDLRSIVLEYMGEKIFNDEISVDTILSAADKLNKRLLLRNPSPGKGNFIYKIYTALKDFHSHKWMYDADSLIGYFKRSGFVDVQQMHLHESRIDGIESVEDAKRFSSGSSICVEGIKPNK